MAAEKLRPVHPGEILRNDFLEPLGLTAYRLANEDRQDGESEDSAPFGAGIGWAISGRVSGQSAVKIC